MYHGVQLRTLKEIINRVTYASFVHVQIITPLEEYFLFKIKPLTYLNIG